MLNLYKVSVCQLKLLKKKIDDYPIQLSVISSHEENIQDIDI